MISPDILTTFDSIIQSVNQDIGADIICYYAGSPTGVSTGVVQMYGSNLFDIDGNSISMDSYPGSQGSTTSPSRVVYTTGVVKARAYVVTNSFRLAAYGITDPTNVYQLNCQVQDIPALTQAEYIDIQPKNKPNIRVRATMIKAPAPYGFTDTSVFGFWRAT